MGTRTLCFLKGLTQEQEDILGKLHDINLSQRELEMTYEIKRWFEQKNTFKRLKDTRYIHILLTTGLMKEEDLRKIEYQEKWIPILFEEVFPLFQNIIEKCGISELEKELEMFKESKQMEFFAKNLREHFMNWRVSGND